jgi:glycosidase
MTEQTEYQLNGYADRDEYLHSLAKDHGIPYEDVKMVADMLGESEDFDALVSALEDYEE